MTEYIEIRNWEKFQHADATKRGRDPIWIKNYTRLLSDDDYLGLTTHRRAILHGLWLEYARSGRRLPLDTRSLSHRLGCRVTTADITAIKTHGFITIRQDSGVTTSSLEERREDKRQQDQPLRTTDPVDVGDLVGDREPASTGASGVLTRPGSVLERVEARAAAELGGDVVDLAARRALLVEQVDRGAGGFGAFMDSLSEEA